MLETTAHIRSGTRSRPWPGTVIKLGISLLMVASVWIAFHNGAHAGQCPSIFQQHKFCRLTYGVQFPMLEKSSVIGAGRNPSYAEVFRRTGQQPHWNFHTYLVDRSERVLSFEASAQPNDRRPMRELARMLAARPAVASTRQTDGGA